MKCAIIIDRICSTAKQSKAKHMSLSNFWKEEDLEKLHRWLVNLEGKKDSYFISNTNRNGDILAQVFRIARVIFSEFKIVQKLMMEIFVLFEIYKELFGDYIKKFGMGIDVK